MQTSWQLIIGALVLACILSATLIRALMPLLRHYALARPNARSSHVVPTPQGGGVAVIAATLFVGYAAAFFSPDKTIVANNWTLFAAVAALTFTGLIDDLRTIEVLPRLALQFFAVGAAVAALPAEVHVTSWPLWAERIIAVIAGVWFVNLTNFMDGIDLMTVVEVVAVTVGISLIGLTGALPDFSTLLAAALLGAIIGFAPFNRPTARLFLGDVGSLPIGLLLFWMLVQLAGRGFLCAALLLPLYYLADATITLVQRAAKGERVTQAHRSHFYQIATERGLTVPAIITRVAVVNAALVILAVISVRVKSLSVDIAAMAIGCALVASLLISLSRGKR
jgi:UDP-N-acetylmuramyl pentapeptide phosphotransferase/UDP-N-acetylglucosamine-1-phosphate transferase